MVWICDEQKMVQQLMMTEMVKQPIGRRLRKEWVDGIDQVLKILGVEV